MNTEFHDDEVDLESTAELIEETTFDDTQEEVSDTQESSDESSPLLQESLGVSEPFKLLNVHLVDSLSKGRIQSMGIDGGTVLTGRNGQGKTSLLSAILLFYGVEPTNLVSRGKDSFVNYYLPRSTSFLAYEYQRGDGQRRMVVAYSNSTGDKVHFRLVRTGFDRSMFLTEDKKLVVNKDFRRRLFELKVPHAERQIETYKDYRCIMQFWQDPSEDKATKRKLKELSADYALTPYRASGSLRHLEKLIKGMFSREANFDDLKALVADWVFEGTQSKGIKTDKDKVANYPRDYRAYQRVMSIEGNLEGAQESFLAHQGAKEELGAIKEKFIFVRDHLDAQIREMRAEATRLQDTLDTEQEKHGQNLGELQLKIATIKGHIETLSQSIHEIEAKQAEYEQMGINSMVTKYAQLPAMEAELSHDQEQLDALDGEASKIRARFENLIILINQDMNTIRETSSTEQDREFSAREQKVKAVEYELQLAIEDVETEAKDERSVLGKKLGDMQNRMGAAQQQVSNPVVRPELIEAVQQKNDELTAARKVQADTSSKVDKIALALQKIDSAIERADADIANCDTRILKQEEEIERVIKANTPAPDTLLHFLRDSIPDWSTNIAKVINPEILQRNDLDPHLVTGSAQAIYGLSLNLSELEPAKEADETVVQQLKLQEEAKLELLRKSRNALSENRSTLGVERENLQNDLSQARKAALLATSDVQRIEEEFKSVRANFEREKNDALSIAQANLEEVRTLVQQADEALQEFERRTSNAIDDLKRVALTKKEGIERDSRLKIEDLKAAVKRQRIDSDRRIKDLEEMMGQELEAIGADSAKIMALRNAVKAASDQCKIVRGYLETISGWRVWCESHLNKLDTFKQQYEREEAQLSAKNTEVGELVESWNTRKAALQEAIKANREKQELAGGDMGIAVHCIDSELDFVQETSQYKRYDEAWVAKLLKKQMADKKIELKNTLAELESQLSKMKAAFISEPNSQPADYFTDSYRRLSDEEKDDPKCRLDLFSDYFKSRHEEDRRILITGAHVIFGDIDELYSTLRRFSERISRFNTELQQHLTHGSHVFKSITNLNMQLYSSVEELQYWKIIGKISESRASWVTKDQLPDESFVENLTSLLGTWDLNQGIHAEFKSLVGLKGSVEERGTLRHFRTKQDLVNISSNGLSYLILIILFLGFISKIRGTAPVQIAWALDELKNLDSANVYSLSKYLNNNEITLCTAFPDPDAETLQLFKNQYTVDDQRRLKTCEIVAENDLEAQALEQLQ
ncbi:ATP-binding protein [Pseudomonas aeruginosa]